MNVRRRSHCSAALSGATLSAMLRRAVLLLVLVLVFPTVALARHGDGGGDDVRVAGSCGRGASAELRLRSHHGAIEVDFRVRRGRSGERWSVVLVHERRVTVRTTVRTGRHDGLRVRRTLPDFAGADEVTARATGPRGLTCTATGVLTGS
jgi:hypothetical protein